MEFLDGSKPTWSRTNARVGDPAAMLAALGSPAEVWAQLWCGKGAIGY